MEHRNATQAREIFAAMAVGDVGPAFELMTDDFHMSNDVGAGPWREVRGKDGMLDFWTRWMELFDNTFRQEVLDVLGYDDRIVMVLHETGTAHGTPYSNRAIYITDVRDGRWVSMRTVDMDPANCVRFWESVPMPAAAVRVP